MLYFKDVPTEDELGYIFDFYHQRHASIIPFDIFHYANDNRILSCLAISICNRQKFYCCNPQIDFFYVLDYDNRKICIFEAGNNMKYKYTVKIPYGNRSEYFSFIEKIDSVLSEDGLLSLYVDNNPYNLKSYLIIESDDQAQEIEQVINEFKVEMDFEKGFIELLKETAERKWNFFLIPKNLPNLSRVCDGYYFFPEIKFLESNGYHEEISVKRKNVFISYSSRDKNIVHSITDEMERTGMNIWIDKKQIDFGENILESVHNAIAESDLAIIFISNNTKLSNFAFHELSAIWKSIIYKNKSWFIVKLDDVSPENIGFGLSDYLYYDFSVNSNIEELLNAINKKLSKI